MVDVLLEGANQHSLVENLLDTSSRPHPQFAFGTVSCSESHGRCMPLAGRTSRYQDSECRLPHDAAPNLPVGAVETTCGGWSSVLLGVSRALCSSPTWVDRPSTVDPRSLRFRTGGC